MGCGYNNNVSVRLLTLVQGTDAFLWQRFLKKLFSLDKAFSTRLVLPTLPILPPRWHFILLSHISVCFQMTKVNEMLTFFVERSHYKGMPNLAFPHSSAENGRKGDFIEWNAADCVWVTSGWEDEVLQFPSSCSVLFVWCVSLANCFKSVYFGIFVLLWNSSLMHVLSLFTERTIIWNGSRDSWEERMIALQWAPPISIHIL